MKANKFVKEFGLDSFKAAMLCPQFKRYNYTILYSDEVDFSNEFIEKHSEYMFKTSVIKRLVESHNLVGRFGGLHMAKADVMDLDGWEKTSPYWMEIQQAIADVESCCA